MLNLFAVSAGCTKFDAHSLFSIAQHRWVEQEFSEMLPLYRNSPS